MSGGAGNPAGKSNLPGMHDPERGIVPGAVCDIVPERADTMGREHGAMHNFYDHQSALSGIFLNERRIDGGGVMERARDSARTGRTQAGNDAGNLTTL